MYCQLRLSELKNADFKTKHHFFHTINYDFRGGEFQIPGEFQISYYIQALIISDSKTCALVNFPTNTVIQETREWETLFVTSSFWTLQRKILSPICRLLFLFLLTTRVPKEIPLRPYQCTEKIFLCCKFLKVKVCKCLQIPRLMTCLNLTLVVGQTQSKKSKYSPHI